MSTVWLFFNYFLMGAIIQFLTATICYWILPQSWGGWIMPGDSCGIWFNLVFKYCFFNSENPIKMCCCRLMIKKIHYPFILLAIIQLMDIFDFKFRIDALIGLGIAYLQCRFFKANPLSCCGICDKCCSKCPMTSFDCWINPSESRVWPEGPFAQLEGDLGVLQQHDSADYTKNNYFGSKGVTLSDD